MAGKLHPAAFHLPLLPAAAALIEDPVKSVGAERLVDSHLIFFLPRKIIERESLVQDRVDLVDRPVLDLFCREQTLDRRADLHLSFLKVIVERIPRKRPVRGDHENRHFQRLKKHPHSSRQRRRRPVKRIARFGVHEHGSLILPDRVFDVRNEGDVGNEFLGRNAAEIAHEALFSHEAVRCADDVISLREKDLRRDLEVEKTRMVHEDQIRPFPRLLHILLLEGKLHGAKVGDRGNAHDQAQDAARLFRFLMRRALDLHDLMKVHLSALDLHLAPSPLHRKYP